ncbi:T9SS type A sorting domain-containing protein [Flavobacterium silvisoli]|uniref:T9SS type A sorting domain-containing protein n=1 Tax=Flavobacterium silvisoli TaxID=2529433 RepID=A0A4V2L5E6_9FLAO|nr:T9SS type A sorting domain-containing protein [Flavobacterium silvisoli]TBX70015.1 T9SS type A sorting domain-containing protein [Flavobacterium silvisoli]
MKSLLLFGFLTLSLTVSSQTLIQSVNSGSVIANSSSISVGEIVVVPQNQNQSSTGIIGLLAQTQQALEVPQLELSNKITVFPNPTTATVYFQTETNLTHEKVLVFNITGQLVSEQKIAADNSLDLSILQNGVYLIQFSNKNINSFKIIKH